MEDYNKLLSLKSKIMLQKINKLKKIYKMLLQEKDSVEINSLEIIENQYLKMYNEIIKEKKFEKYKNVEDIIIKEISKIELKLDKYVYDTIQYSQQIIQDNIKKIKTSKNYENFLNITGEIDNVETLKELLKLYGPYISKAEEENFKNEISLLKFDVLFRKQVEELIYQYGDKNNYLKQYNSKYEKEIFKKLLDEKITTIKSSIKNNESLEDKYTILKDEVFRLPLEQVLADTRLLERLIIIDMKIQPYNYINLLKAKVFNAHLCNIGNNPFKRELYITKEQIKKLGYLEIYDRDKEFKGLEADKVNYSLLYSIIKDIITDENVSIIECENLYKRFGFKCNPIFLNIGQECVKMIYDSTKDSQKVTELVKDIREERKDNENAEENYCIIDFKGLTYEFNSEEFSEDLFNQILNKRNNEIMSTSEIFEKRHSKKTDKTLQEKEKNILPIDDMDKIMLLIKDTIYRYTNEIEKLEQELEENKENESSINFEIIKREKRIEEGQNQIELLEELKKKNGKLTLDESRNLLLIINNIYTILEEDNCLSTKYNERKLLPLENIKSVHLAPIPERTAIETREISHSFYRFEI